MEQTNVRRLAVATAVTALLATALAAPAMAVPDREPKAGPKVEQQAKAEAKAIRRAQRQARAEVRAEAKAARKQARAEARLARKAARQAKAEAKSVCKDGGWKDLVAADSEVFRNQGQCVKYVVHGGQSFVHDGTPRSAETILVVAYSDKNGTPGYQADGVDVLISKLLDDNGSGVPDDGDSIVMGQYPMDHAATAFGGWGVTSHAVGFTIGTNTNLSAITGSGHQHRWLKTADDEAYSEAGSYTSSFYDRLDGRDDSISTRHGSPSEPDSSLTNNDASDGDEDFIDVAFYY